MKPQILFIDHAGVLGGGELSLLDIVYHFRETGHVVLFEDGPFRTELERRGISVEIIEATGPMRTVTRNGRLWQDLRAIPAMFRLVLKVVRCSKRFDVIYTNSQKSMLIGALAGLIARKPVFWHLRDLMTEDHFSGLHRRITTMFGNRLISRIIANSKATRHAFVKNGGRPERVVTIHNGIDEKPFAGIRRDESKRLRAELGIDGEPLLGLFSRLASWKGQHILLEAMSKMPSVHALLVGDALFRDDIRYFEELQQQVSRLGLTNRIHFLGFRKDIPQLLQAVDIVLHTSVAPEPFGRVIVEGMLAGKPVVATNAGGAAEIVEDGVTGRLVPPGDPGALRQVLVELLEHPDLRNSIANAGYESARLHYTLHGMLKRIDQQIQTVQR